MHLIIQNVYHTLSNQKCEIQSTLIYLNHNEFSQELHCYPLTVKLDRCVGSCNTLNDLSSKICVPDETEDLNLSLFNVMTGINDISKDISKAYSMRI